jgi:hypothetical protein
MRSLIASLFVAGLSLVSGPTSAVAQVHVPGDYSTIQAAINSGATLVYIADGHYYETLSIQRSVTLLPEPPADAYHPSPIPHVTAMNITRNNTDYPVVYVRGLHFTGLVSQTNAYTRYGSTTLEGCKLDGGFTTYGSSGVEDAIRIRSCVITGDVYLYAYHNDFSGNMVWKGSVDVHSNGGNGALARNNLVIGPSAVGIASTSPDVAGSVTDNIVLGTTTGYSIVTGTVSTNAAIECGTGYANSGTGGSRTFSGNSALKCGIGINLTATMGVNAISANSIDSSSTYGIHTAPGVVSTCTSNGVRNSGSHGIWMEGDGDPTSNSVLSSGGNGIRAHDRAERNTVGRSVQHGIVAAEARHNTVYLSSGAGYYINGAAPDTISNNIGYGNASYGIIWAGTGTPRLACNDWYANSLGSTSGVSMGATDLSADPLFCDLATNYVYLRTTSPCANPAGCGQIGSRVVACGAAVDAPPLGEETVRFSVVPNPSQRDVEMHWARSNVPSRIEVYDLTGALRFRSELPGETTQFRWAGEDGAHRALPGGVYFVRRTAGDVVENARVVIAR